MERVSKHLTVFVHGYLGVPGHMTEVVRAFQKSERGNDFEILISQGNEFFRTCDGVRECGNRLCEEILGRLKSGTYDRLSIVGYSMGGLFARYAIGKLYKQGINIRFVNFLTFATPHVGVSFKIPSLLGGDDLRPDSMVLRDLADSLLEYVPALAAFETRVSVVNTCDDRPVCYESASLFNKNEDPLNLSHIKHHGRTTYKEQTVEFIMAGLFSLLLRILRILKVGLPLDNNFEEKGKLHAETLQQYAPFTVLSVFFDVVDAHSTIIARSPFGNKAKGRALLHHIFSSQHGASLWIHH